MPIDFLLNVKINSEIYIKRLYFTIIDDLRLINLLEFTDEIAVNFKEIKSMYILIIIYQFIIKYIYRILYFFTIKFSYLLSSSVLVYQNTVVWDTLLFIVFQILVYISLFYSKYLLNKHQFYVEIMMFYLINSLNSIEYYFIIYQ